MYLFYIVFRASASRVKQSRLPSASLSVGSLKVLDGEWESALKDPVGKHNNRLVYQRP